MSLEWRPNSSSPWTMITTILLNDAGDLSGGLTLPAGNANYGYSSADGDVTWLMPAFGGPDPPGTFNDYSGSTGWGPDPSTDWQRPAHSNYQVSSGDYYLPNTAVYYDQPGNPYLQFQFDIMAWTGNYSSFAAAVHDPTCWVGDTGPFQPSNLMFVNEPAVPMDNLANMPNLVLQHPIGGDANLDGRVDINDLTIVLANYGQSGMTWDQGEFTGDGTVDINDLTIVLAHYGQSIGGAGSLSTVPEPASLGLLSAGIACVALLFRRRRG